MPIAGGILVAGSAARCLSSAAGMLRFLARLSGRRRHVRRSCGPGGGCCVQTGETRTATTTRTTTTAASSVAASAAREVAAGGTTTMTSVRQDRRCCCDESPISRIHDPSWLDENFRHPRISHDEQDPRLSTASENHHDVDDDVDRAQVHPLRQERTRSSDSHQGEKSHRHHSHPDSRGCSRLSEDHEFCEIPRNTPISSMDRLADAGEIHRVEQIPESQRLTRRQQRLRRTSGSRLTTTTTTTTTTTSETTSDNEADQWRTRPDYVDLIVAGHHHENRQRGNVQEEPRDNSSSGFCNSGPRRSRIPPYLATLLIISYTLFGIADACSSRSTPKPRPPTVTSRPNITFHMYTCPPDYAEWYCLNGATCFTVKIQESLLYNCICSDGFIGQRCEFKDLDGSYLPSRQRVMLETASIAGGATIAVFLVVIICIAAYIHCKRKQKELRTSSTCVDTVDGPGRDPELRPFSNRSLMIFMAKNPNGSTMCPSIEQTRMPAWNDFSQMESARMASVNEGKRGTSQ